MGIGTLEGGGVGFGVGGVFACGVPPPKNQRFSLTNVSGLLDTRKGTLEKKVSTYFLVCKLSIDDVGVSRDTVFQEI